MLNGQIEQLRNELVRSGAAGGLPADPATALTRLDQLEAELRRLTDRVDVLTNDIEPHRRGRDQPGRRHRVPADRARGRRHQRRSPRPRRSAAASRGRGRGRSRRRWRPEGAGRAGGRPSSRTSTRRWRRPTPATTPRRRQLFATFLQTYPGGPLSTEAQYRRGEALAAQQDWRGAARSFLDAFSGAPQDPLAPRALYQLAVSLGELGQTDEACLTLTEVDSRYPGSEVAGDVAAERQALACQ